jgi:(2Fe-2S) ferredoxin
MSLRRRLIFVCINRRPDGTPKGSCAARGSVELYSELKELLRSRGLADTEVRACSSSCLDACTTGPAICVEPDHFLYSHVTRADLSEVVDGLVTGRRVERLILPAHRHPHNVAPVPARDGDGLGLTAAVPPGVED